MMWGKEEKYLVLIISYKNYVMKSGDTSFWLFLLNICVGIDGFLFFSYNSISKAPGKFVIKCSLK